MWRRPACLEPQNTAFELPTNRTRVLQWLHPKFQPQPYVHRVHAMHYDIPIHNILVIKCNQQKYLSTENCLVVF